jgi:hypothetical protein
MVLPAMRHATKIASMKRLRHKGMGTSVQIMLLVMPQAVQNRASKRNGASC